MGMQMRIFLAPQSYLLRGALTVVIDHISNQFEIYPPAKPSTSICIHRFVMCHAPEPRYLLPFDRLGAKGQVALLSRVAHHKKVEAYQRSRRRQGEDVEL